MTKPTDSTEDAVLRLAMHISSGLVQARRLADDGHIPEAAAAVVRVERLCSQVDGHLKNYRQSLERLAGDLHVGLPATEAALPV